MKLHHIKNNILKLILTLIFITLGLIVFYTPEVNADTIPSLTNQFPIPSAHYVTDHQDDTAYDNMAWNYMIASNHGISRVNRFGVYYDTPVTSSNPRVITLSQSSISYCRDRTGGSPATQIKISASGATAITLSGKDQICTTTNIVATSSTFDRYSSRYKVIYEVRLAEPSSNTPSYYDEDNHGQRKMSFHVSAPGGIIGNLDAGDTGALNNTVYYKSRGGNEYYATSKFTFGLSCDDNPTEQHQITLYDADNGGSAQVDRNVEFRIYENGTALPRSRYVSGTISGGSLDGSSSNPYITPYDGSSNSASVDIVMYRGRHYMLKVWNIGHDVGVHNGSGAGGDNFIAIGVPGDSIYGTSQYSCTYELEPYINNASSYIEAGSSFNIDPRVKNSAGSRTSDIVTTTLVKTITGPGGSSTSTTSHVGSFPAGASDTPVLGTPDSDTDYLPGTVMCYVLTISPYMNDAPSSSRSSSPPVCVTIVKRPKMQVWGGDLSVAGDVKTSRKTISPLIAHPLAGRTFGSWVEYAIFARGSIFVDAKRGAASGSAFAGSGLGTNLDCSYSTLTFSNAAAGAGCVDGDKKGGYPTASLPEIKNSFPGGENRTTNETIAPNSLDSGTYNWGSNNVTLTTSELDPGKSVIIKAPSGTVTIAGSQKYYGGSYDKISDIPQLVIIANNIVINNDVDNVDAWLVATNNAKTGSIKTCVDVAKSSGECNTPLIVNGPVVTNKLYLYRTAGSDGIDSSGAPAEVFNLRADAYLWAYVRSIGHIRTVRTTELPPRY